MKAGFIYQPWLQNIQGSVWVSSLHIGLTNCSTTREIGFDTAAAERFPHKYVTLSTNKDAILACGQCYILVGETFCKLFKIGQHLRQWRRYCSILKLVRLLYTLYIPHHSPPDRFSVSKDRERGIIATEPSRGTCMTPLWRFQTPSLQWTCLRRCMTQCGLSIV